MYLHQVSEPLKHVQPFFGALYNCKWPTAIIQKWLKNLEGTKLTGRTNTQTPTNSTSSCGMLRPLVACCVLLRHAAASCGMLRPLAACCGLLRHAAASCGMLRPLAACYVLLRHAASSCGMLQPPCST